MLKWHVKPTTVSTVWQVAKVPIAIVRGITRKFEAIARPNPTYRVEDNRRFNYGSFTDYIEASLDAWGYSYRMYHYLNPHRDRGGGPPWHRDGGWRSTESMPFPAGGDWDFMLAGVFGENCHGTRFQDSMTGRILHAEPNRLYLIHGSTLHESSFNPNQGVRLLLRWYINIEHRRVQPNIAADIEINSVIKNVAEGSTEEIEKEKWMNHLRRFVEEARKI